MDFSIIKYSADFKELHEWQYEIILDNEWNLIWSSIDEYVMNTILVNYDDDLLYLDEKYNTIQYQILSYDDLSDDDKEIVIQLLIRKRKVAQRTMLDIEEILEKML